jgi:glucan phosphoethanolaminetransferase (alkaline phosphatase superfamily)
MVLTPLEVLTGSFSLVTVVISTIIGLRIASKYFINKRRELLLVGFTWILLCEIWWSSAFSFLAALFTGVGFNPELYFTLGNLFVPVALLLWLTAYTDFLYKHKQKLILIIATITGVMYYFAFFYFIFNDVAVIGVMFNSVDAEYRSFALVYLISVLLVFLITGVNFARTSIRSDNVEIRLKGKFLLIAVILFTVGAALDGLKPFLFESILNVILIINRIILILSGLAFYSGFLLPRWIKDLILKEE